jgi:hypothetical protein
MAGFDKPSIGARLTHVDPWWRRRIDEELFMLASYWLHLTGVEVRKTKGVNYHAVPPRSVHTGLYIRCAVCHAADFESVTSSTLAQGRSVFGYRVAVGFYPWLFY